MARVELIHGDSFGAIAIKVAILETLPEDVRDVLLQKDSRYREIWFRHQQGHHSDQGERTGKARGSRRRKQADF